MNSLTDKVAVMYVYRDLRVEVVEDFVATESEVEVYVNGERFGVFVTSPHLLEELGIGIAVSMGYSRVVAVKVVNNRIDVVTNTRGVKQSRLSSIRMGIEAVFKVVEEAMNRAQLFKETGCFHFAAASTLEGEILYMVEDIARHIALYKLLGKLIKMGIDLTRTVLVMSSRVNSEMVKAIANAEIPIAIFRGAPTKQAIEIADRSGITLIAFARSGKINIYTHSERIAM